MRFNELTAPSHCPWIYNCVGINNHRHFFLYLINMTFGVVMYDLISYYCKITSILLLSGSI